jgi:hypothetical protein
VRLDRDLTGAASRRGAPKRKGRNRGLVGVASCGRSRLLRAKILGRGLAGTDARGSIHRFHDDEKVALRGQRGGRWRRGLRLWRDSKPSSEPRAHTARRRRSASPPMHTDRRRAW